MKFKVMFILVVVFVLFGCSTYRRAVSNYDACIHDVDCRARMVRNAEAAKVVGNSFNVSSESFLGILLSNLVSALTGVVYGRKVGKRKG